MVVNEDILVEIVRPGTGDPVPAARSARWWSPPSIRAYPLVRFGDRRPLGGAAGSPVRPHQHAHQGLDGPRRPATKVRGMFVDPAQIAAILKRHPNIGRARLLVTREGDLDATRLQVEGEKHAIDVVRLAQDFHATTGLRLGGADIVPPGASQTTGKLSRISAATTEPSSGPTLRPKAYA